MDGPRIGVSCRQQSNGDELELETFSAEEMASVKIFGLQMDMEPKMWIKIDGIERILKLEQFWVCKMFVVFDAIGLKK